MHIKMEYSFYVQTVLRAAFFLVSSHTQLITLKSACLQFLALLFLTPNTRVDLASIKYFGNCPCPRCLIEKSQISQIGTKLDAKRRENYRLDSESRQEAIEL